MFGLEFILNLILTFFLVSVFVFFHFDKVKHCTTGDSKCAKNVYTLVSFLYTIEYLDFFGDGKTNPLI